MGACPNHDNFMRAQACALRKEIERDKEKLSEKMESEVDFEEAESHFMDFHIDDWASGFREGFCASCPHRAVCGMRDTPDVDVVDELSGLRNGLQNGRVRGHDVAGYDTI